MDELVCLRSGHLVPTFKKKLASISRSSFDLNPHWKGWEAREVEAGTKGSELGKAQAPSVIMPFTFSF
jgi:hypothetical protein